MAQAAVIPITGTASKQPPQKSGDDRNEPNTSDRAPRFAEAFQELEGDICDVVSMARLLSAATEGAFGEPDGDCFIAQPEAKMLVWAASHLQEMTDKLRDGYYAAFSGGSPC